MGEVEIAHGIAAIWHGDQVDKAGQPYLRHVERVVANLLREWPAAIETEIAAAWLHDVVEDTPLTGHDLLEAGISRETVAVVYELTRPRGDYLGYIADLAAWGSMAAVRVKLADNEDNSDPARVAAIPEGARMLEKRYRPARELLLARVRQEVAHG